MKGGMKTTTPLPKDWREGRRLRAWELNEQGWKQKDIAAALGVTEGAVSQWMTKGKTQGPEALRHQPSPGAPAKLTQEQRSHLPGLLAKGAEAFGFRGQVWTAARVAVVIKREFGVSYHPTHCGRLLKAIKHSLQKPESQASQRDAQAIQTWREQRAAELKKRPKRKSGPSSL
jgi:transposase